MVPIRIVFLFQQQGRELALGHNMNYQKDNRLYYGWVKRNATSTITAFQIQLPMSQKELIVFIMILVLALVK